MEPLAPGRLAQKLGLLFIISISLPQCFKIHAQTSTVILDPTVQIPNAIQPTGRVTLPMHPPFEVPLRFTDGLQADTLYFGILLGADVCINPADGLNGHFEQDLPPPPPSGVFDVRFVAPPGRLPACYDQGSPCDYRPFTSASQKDTFRVRAQLGAGFTTTFCWPAGLSAYFTELTICGINALMDTCLTYPGEPWPCEIRSGGLVESVEEDPRGTLPEDFVLYQNYPNPFNPSTEIRFRIEVSGFSTLKVYDVLGREVATLVEGEQEASEYRVQWSPEGLSSGIYTYRLTTSGATIAKKMLLLR
jgi:hypothetical protein